MKIKSLILASVLTVFTAASASAVDLVNEDDVSFTVRIEDDNGAKEVVIEAMQAIENICSDCIISLGEASFSTEGITALVIRDGELDVK